LDGLIDGKFIGWMVGCTDRWVVDGLMDDRMDRLMVEYMDECVDGWMDVRWVDEGIGGWMDGKIDGRIYG
jgi:hypothetical protein